MSVLPAEPNKLDSMACDGGGCSCGADVPAGKGFFIRQLRKIVCASCRETDVTRVEREATPATITHEKIKARIYWNAKVQRAVLALLDVSLPILEAVKGLCESRGFSYNSDLGGWVGQIVSVPEIVEILEAASIRVEVSDNAAQALQAKADQNKKAVAGASIRVANVTRRGKTLKEYQKRGIEFLSVRTVALLADDPGVGKTAQVLSAAGPKPRMMVVAPKIMVGTLVKGVPTGGWADEAALWRPDIEKVTILRTRDEFRWPEENELVLLNYELMPVSPDELARDAIKASKARREAIAKGLTPEEPPVKHHTVAGEPPIGVELVCDEVHALANPNSQRTKRFKHLRSQVLKRGGKIRGVSATPTKNNAKELYAVLDAIGAAQQAFGSYEAYARLHNYQPKQVARNKVTWEFGEPSPQVAERLKTVMLRRKKRDVLTELPTLTVRRLIVDVDREAMKACDAAMKEIERSGLDVEQAMEIVDQSRCDGMDFTKISAALAALAKVKAPHALERATEYERTGTPVIFMAAHLSVVEMLGARQGWGCLVGGDRATINLTGETVSMKGPEVAKRFQAGEINSVSATLQYAGAGVNLHRASEMLMVEQLWNPAMNTQGVGRMERLGQKNAMVLTVMVANHPLDLRMCEVLEKKLDLYAATIDAAAVSSEDLDKREDVIGGLLEAAKKTAQKRSQT